MNALPGLAGRVALVTGSTRGIGAAIAWVLAREGVTVAVCGRSSMKDATELARQIQLETGAHTEAFTGDVSSASAVTQMVERVTKRLGPVDILVNNAGGVSRQHATLEASLHEWRVILALNLTAPFLLSQAVLPAMLARGWGRIINIGSSVGRMPTSSGSVAYTTAKTGLVGLTRHLAIETLGTGVTANLISPGSIMTGDRIRVLWDSRPGGLSGYEASLPMRRLGRPEEVAGVVPYLVSDLGAYTTGAVIDINGGLVLA